MKFDKIKNLKFFTNYAENLKLHNSLYLEDLTSLFAAASAQINTGTYYYFDEDYYTLEKKEENGKKYENFINDFKNSLLYGATGTINIIKGKAGTGKTLFFEKGISEFLRREFNMDQPYIKLIIDLKRLEPKQKVDYYTEKIYDIVHDKAIDAIRLLGKDILSQFETRQEEDYGKNSHTPYARLFPLQFFCREIFSRSEEIPCIVVFDNIDMLCVNTQRSLYDAISTVCREFKDSMEHAKALKEYRIYMTFRPETPFREEKDWKTIDFPLPNILKISLAVLKANLEAAANELDKVEKLKCGITLTHVITNEEIHLAKFINVANYFSEILEKNLNFEWKSDSIINRLDTCEEFHCNISNYDVRKFLTFIAETIGNGGFKPLTKDGIKYDTNYSVFEYVEMVIRGRWEIHSGNKHMNGDGRNKNSPIIFNLFDTREWERNHEEKVRHFMLYIRVLQYASFNVDDFMYGELEETLGDFFDKTHIMNATKKLIHVRILYSHYDGDDNVASKDRYTQIYLEENTRISYSATGGFYLDKLICEFEYLYQMAISSLMPDEHIKKLNGNNSYKSEKELVVYYFLDGIFEIIKNNIADYNAENGEKFERFKDFVCREDSNVSSPYRRMLKQFQNVLHYKICAREKHQNVAKKEQLEAILTNTQRLEKVVIEYFKENKL